jgi:hypothetical protein
MPYIKKSERKALDELIDKYIYDLQDKGHINYLLFKLAKKSCNSYNDFRTFIGELECCKFEIERRLLIKYEDKKISENGDVE